RGGRRSGGRRRTDAGAARGRRGAGACAGPAARGYHGAGTAPAGSRPWWRAACGPCQAAAARNSGGATTQGGNMDRQAWLEQRRAAVLTSYDQDAATYDDHGYPATAQQDWVARLLRTCPPAAMILDAPCGTGQYFSLVAAAGTA